MKVIIFDFDGTIADSFHLIVEIAHKLAGRKDPVTADELERMRALTLIELAKQLGVPRWKWPFLIYLGRRQMAQKIKTIRPFPGLADTLSSLHNDQYVLTIVSTNTKRNIDRFLVQHGLGGYFDQVYGGVGLYSKSKTLSKIISKNGVSSTEAMYIGDEIRDVEAAKRVNMPVIAVGWGFNTPEMLAEHAPTIVVRQPKQLLAVIEEWNKP